MPQPQINTRLNCIHCQTPVPANRNADADGKAFCCDGCEAVYHLLRDNNLCDYYRFDTQAGRKKTDTRLPADDELAVMAGDFITYQDEKQVNLTFDIPGMHCASCVWLLEKLPGVRPGILYTRVDFIKKKLDIYFDPEQTGFADIVRLLDALGYTPSLVPDGKAIATGYNRKTLLKLAVAGFCFGNIMLFSFPEYLGLEEQGFKQLFSWLNLLLSIPVVVFSAGHFYTQSFISWQRRDISVDVPLVLGISALWLRSAYEVISQTGPGYFDSLTGLIFFLVIGKWLQERTWDAIRFDRDAARFFPLSTRVIRDGLNKAIRVFDLVAGDRVAVRNQELIPGDGILMSHHALIDYSYVSGEAEPVYKVAGEMLYAGGRAVEGALEMEVVRPFTDSRLRQMWSNAARKGEPLGAVSIFANKVSKWFTLGTVLLALLAFLFWLPRDLSIAMFAATAVLMVACPCALAIATPFALSNATRILGRNGFYLRNPEVVETLASIHHIVFDKTGTLTNPAQTEISWILEPGSHQLKEFIVAAAAQSSHPYSAALVKALNIPVYPRPDRFHEKPGMGLEAVFGAHVLRIGRMEWVSPDTSRNGSDQISSSNAVGISLDGKLAASFLTHNPLRSEVPAVLQNLRTSYRLSLLSGDSDKDLQQLERQLPGVFESLRFRHDPASKVAYIRELEQQGRKVMMIGDGLNDAGALKAGHAGVVLAQDVTQFAPASSAILLHSDMERFPVFMRFAAQTARASRESFYFSLIYNAIGLWFAASGQLSPLFAAVLMPVSSISVALFAVYRTRRFARKESLL
jgi:Cu+-exporting ATPase